ncbi:14269_t:CDS:2 [Entrophospora sp. SA101]|nr:14269_t:CDS:2 [Entrophospora sp. SA101]CAJ0823563.1 3135_t:CDS:2 [Entrophospora sp. SA101]CAJ0902942.1 1057_t:CDS:2 [Entrophospora sp. SA101]CAJ0908081.1 14986_t:CDS:2 [Entrophospora sp. SA101]
MDLKTKLEEIKRQLENGEINIQEHKKRHESIMKKWLNGSNETEHFNVVNEPEETSLYDILQLKKGATDAEIKKSFKDLALKHHPDKNGNTKTEEWNKLLKAYEILSDNDKRFLYDNHGTINNSLGNKTSFNQYVGGDSWKAYIGDLEIGLFLFSYVEEEKSPELTNLTSAEQKKRRHDIRVSDIVQTLQSKLSQFSKQNDKLLEESLQEEAQKLSMEPNGKNLLLLLGKIYISKAETCLNKYSKQIVLNKFCNIFDNLDFATGVISSFVAVKTKGGPLRMNREEICEVVWRLSRSEISLIIREVCDKLLDSYSENNEDLAKSLHLLGEIWSKKTNKQSNM